MTKMFFSITFTVLFCHSTILLNCRVAYIALLLLVIWSGPMLAQGAGNQTAGSVAQIDANSVVFGEYLTGLETLEQYQRNLLLDDGYLSLYLGELAGLELQQFWQHLQADAHHTGSAHWAKRPSQSYSLAAMSNIAQQRRSAFALYSLVNPEHRRISEHGNLLLDISVAVHPNQGQGDTGAGANLSFRLDLGLSLHQLVEMKSKELVYQHGRSNWLMVQ